MQKGEFPLPAHRPRCRPRRRGAWTRSFLGRLMRRGRIPNPDSRLPEPFKGPIQPWFRRLFNHDTSPAPVHARGIPTTDKATVNNCPKSCVVAPGDTYPGFDFATDPTFGPKDEPLEWLTRRVIGPLGDLFVKRAAEVSVDQAVKNEKLSRKGHADTSAGRTSRTASFPSAHRAVGTACWTGRVCGSEDRGYYPEGAPGGRAAAADDFFLFSFISLASPLR